MTPARRSEQPAFFPAARSKSSRQLRDEIVRWVVQLRAFIRPAFDWDSDDASLQASLMPIDSSGRLRHACPVRLRGFDERGVAFEHSRPLPDRRAVFSLESPEFGRFIAEIDLGWSRYLEGGGYASGGRIVKISSVA